MNIIGIIPSRYNSVRFPGKPLVDIEGKSMIRRVFEQASLSKELDEVYIATDDERIKEHALQFTPNIIMTSPNHRSGTSRCFEAVNKIDIKGLKSVINIQGDEPFINPVQLDIVANQLKNSNDDVVTLIKRIEIEDEINNPNRVKVVFDQQQYAMYFSRSPIPYSVSKNSKNLYYKHIGIYGFSIKGIQKINEYSVGKYELIESLEQLGWLENGVKIKCLFTSSESPGIDTPEDLRRLFSS